LERSTKINIIMKKIQKLFLILSFTSLVLFSCGSGSDPKSVAQDFMEALAKQDFEKAKELGTDSTKGFISMIEGLIQMMPEEKKKEGLGDISGLKWGETKIDGDKAVVYYTDPEGKQDKIELKKVDGEWKVDMKKDL